MNDSDVYVWQEKGKYEVTSGQLKTAEDLVDFWAELLSRYPAIIALIDPMRKQVSGTPSRFICCLVFVSGTSVDSDP